LCEKLRWAGIVVCVAVGATRVLGSSYAVLPGVLQPVGMKGSLVVAQRGQRDSCVAGVDAETGGSLWRTHLPRVLLNGELCAADNVVCAPAFYDGVYLLDAGNGALKAHLQTGHDDFAPKVCCGSGRILVGNNESHWRQILVAYDAEEGRELWRTSLARCYLWEAASRGNTFVLLASNPFGPGPPTPTTRWTQVTLKADSGRVVSRAAASKPASLDIIPDTLPPPVSEWLTGLLRRKGGVFLARTRIERLGDTWFVGNLPDKTAPSKVFAVQGSTGKVVWQRSVPGLGAIALLDDRLIAAGDRTKETSSRLQALDARTGRFLWALQLEEPA